MTERKPRKRKKTAGDYRKRKHPCTFYLSSEEHAALERVIASRGCSAAAFLRHVITRADAGLRPRARPQTIVIDPRQMEIETA